MAEEDRSFLEGGVIFLKTVLVAFNARFSHSSLALRYIRMYNKEKNIEVAEYTINDHLGRVFSDLLKKDGDIYCFSVYIWNVEVTLKVAQMLKKATPNVIIVLGGPECSFCPEKLFERYDFIDYIIRGEGEAVTGKLIDAVEKSEDVNIKGVASKADFSEIADCVDLETIVFPFTDKDFANLQNKIIYFETSRGCPFKCSYCLSSIDKSIRYFPMDYVKKGFDEFFRHKVPLVKLVDRTFNANSQRAIEIINYIIENSVCTKVHFEIDPGILTDELTEVLANAPKDLFQLEMGIQSANPDTLKAVNRNDTLLKTAENIKKLKQADNMHIHLDLIAGLPEEDYKSFEKSFNYVYSLKPDMLQLGFLKVLHGTPITENQDILYCDFPPYEVISTKWLTAEEICKLKLVDKAVDSVNNSGVFKRTVKKLVGDNAFSVFEKISVIFDTEKALSRFDVYGELYKIFGDVIYEELCLDFLENSPNRPMPEFANIKYPANFKKDCKKYLDENNMPFENIRFEPIGNKVYMMDYKNKKMRLI